MATRQVLPASSVTRTLSVLGDSWTLLILLNAFRGACRFGEWFGLLGIPRPVLSDRLARLTRAKILERVRYQSNPPRFEYRLTERGLELWPFTLAIWDWEKRWVSGSAGFAFDLEHDACGRDVHPRFFCSRCDHHVGADDIERRSGPGAGKMTLPARRQRRSSLADDETTRVFGDRWTMLLIYAGLRGVTRYNVMQAELGVSSHLLALRVKELVELGIFVRARYSKKPPRYEYHLTPKGRDIYKLGVFAMYWGDRWLTSGGAPTIVIHRSCGQRLLPELRCDHCGGTLHRTACRFEPEYVPKKELTVETP
jgi:DNA-binding HxlR family transcriptional regulator